MLIDGSDAANLSGDMVQNFVCDNRANTELFGAMGSKTPSKIMEAPIYNSAQNIKPFFDFAKA